MPALDPLAELEMVATGCAVVLAVLALLWAVTAAFGAAFVRLARPTAPVEAPGVPPAHVAAIAAAVAAVTRVPHRIVRVTAPVHKATAWAAEGRHEHAAGHRVRPVWGPPYPPLNHDHEGDQ